MSASDVSRVAILGGGYAGMAAAVELAAAGVPVTVFEAGKVLGGRARRVVLDGQTLDNGQHLLIGAYEELLRLQRQVGVAEATAYLRQPLTLAVLPDFRLRCPRWPAPLHLAWGLLSAQGLAWRDKWQLIRAMQSAQRQHWHLPVDCSVTEWLLQQRQSPQVISRFWAPLTVAALNTPLQQASAQVLLTVLRDSLGGPRAASDMLLPRLDFSALFPEPAARYIGARQGEVRLGILVKHLQQTVAGWQVNDLEERFASVICALPPHRLEMALQSLPELAEPLAWVQDWRWQPIMTVYLRYPAHVQLPQPMLGLADSLAQWVFDRGVTHGEAGLVAVVISAEGAHTQLDQAALAAAVQLELHQRLGLPAQAQSWRVIAEKRATFACVPGMRRPAQATTLPGLWLAGDYTAAEGMPYPATLEAAVRSGVRAAQAVLQSIVAQA